MRCVRCQDAFWICENHPQEPWPCHQCSGAGMPCPRCNTDDPPMLPAGFEEDDDNATRH
jgi:hypothetical protein